MKTEGGQNVPPLGLRVTIFSLGLLGLTLGAYFFLFLFVNQNGKNAKKLEMFEIFKKSCKLQFLTDFHDFGWK